MTNASHPRGRRYPPARRRPVPPAKSPRPAVQAHGFLDCHPRIRQVHQVAILGKTFAESGVDLFFEPPLRLGVLGQQIPGPGQRQRRRFLPGDQKRGDLDSQLLVGHRLTGLFVPRRHQHRQQIGAVGRAATALADHVIDGVPQYRASGLESTVFRPAGRCRRDRATRSSCRYVR